MEPLGFGREQTIMNDSKVVAVCLAILAASLLVVGVVSDTILRHIIQIIPMLFVLGLTWQRPSVGAYMALPIFGFWLFIIVMLWLFFLGVSDLADGTYSNPGIALTFIIAATCALGILKSIQIGKPLNWRYRTTLSIIGLASQVAFIAISIQPAFAYD